MKLPPMSVVQDQVSRLIAYMGDKHRFRLRSSSAMEAVAAMHGQPDWNTLYALANRDADEQAVTHQTYSEVGRYPVYWDADGRSSIEVDRGDWYKHTLATGNGVQRRRGWMYRQMQAQAARGGAGVFLDIWAGAFMPDDVRQVLTERKQLIDLDALAPGMAMNVLADLDVDTSSRILSMALYQRENTPSHDYYRQHAHFVLTVIIAAVRESGCSVTYGGLLELLPRKWSKEVHPLQRLLGCLLPKSDGARALSRLIDSLALGESAGDKSASSSYSLLAQLLHHQKDSAWVRAFFAGEDAPGLYTLLSQGRLLAIETGQENPIAAKAVVIEAMRYALSRRAVSSRTGRTAGWVLGVTEVDQCLSPALVDIVVRGRDGNLAVVMTMLERSLFNNWPMGKDVLANVWNQVHLSGCQQKQLLELLAQMSGQPMLVQPDRITIKSHS